MDNPIQVCSCKFVIFSRNHIQVNGTCFFQCHEFFREIKSNRKKAHFNFIKIYVKLKMNAKESLAFSIPFEFIIFTWNQMLRNEEFLSILTLNHTQKESSTIAYFISFSSCEITSKVPNTNCPCFNFTIFPWNQMQIHYLICKFFVKSISINFLSFSGLPHVPINWSYQLFQMPSRNSFWPTSHGL